MHAWHGNRARQQFSHDEFGQGPDAGAYGRARQLVPRPWERRQRHPSHDYRMNESPLVGSKQVQRVISFPPYGVVARLRQENGRFSSPRDHAINLRLPDEAWSLG